MVRSDAMEQVALNKLDGSACLASSFTGGLQLILQNLQLFKSAIELPVHRRDPFSTSRLIRVER